MKNKINNYINNNKFIFLFALCFGILITLPSFIPSFNVDAYCTIDGGYQEVIKTFLKSGRLFTGLAYFIGSILNVSFSIFSIISILLANIFLSLSIYKIFNYIRKFIKNDKNNIKKILVLLGTFLMIYNPLVIELLLFEESFIMCLGIYFLTLSALQFTKNNKVGYIKSLLLVILGCICYQGIMCFYIPILFMLEVFNLKGNLKKEYITILKKGILAILFYGISLIISFVIVKIINNYIYIDGTQKLGTIDILFNIKKAFELMIKSLISMFGYVNRPIFYIVCLSLFILILLSNFKNDKKHFTKILYLIINLVLCVVMPFVTNLGMNSSLNYTAARMTGSICCVVGIMVIYSIIYFEILKNKKSKLIFIILISIYTLYNSFNFLYTSYVGLRRYHSDMESINIINTKIKDYEKENNKEVKTIKYTTDSQVNYFYYENIITNSYNFRLYAIDWAMKCAVNINKDKKIEYIKMSNKEKEKYFKNKEYDKLDDKQFVFKDDTLYLLIY